MSVDNLVMTDEKICRNYDEAKNKKEQIPEAVKELLNDRISILENVISEALKEKDELVMYLKKAGKSDGIQ